MQVQTTRRLHRPYHFNRGFVIILAALGLLTASIVGIQVLSGGDGASETRDLSPVAAPVVEDPPLPDGWVDSYFDRSIAKPDSTTLNIDRDGADIFTTDEVSGSTSTRLDRASAFEDGMGFTREHDAGVIAPQSPSTRLNRASAIEDGMGFTQERNAGVTVPRSSVETKFFEDNVWDYVSPAQPAGDITTPLTAAEIRFIEENIYGSPPTPRLVEEQGQLNY